MRLRLKRKASFDVYVKPKPPPRTRRIKITISAEVYDYFQYTEGVGIDLEAYRGFVWRHRESMGITQEVLELVPFDGVMRSLGDTINSRLAQEHVFHDGEVDVVLESPTVSIQRG